jgi:mannose-6-phosphate isomerase
LVLGSRTASQFENRLPYLFKVLDARKMLSIQAHPTLAQAAEGFRRENAAGIALDAPNRNYKDQNHKPEVHVALTDFWMLHGFRPLEEIERALEATPELRPLMPEFGARLAQAGASEAERQALLRELYGRAMSLPQAEADAMLNPLIARLAKRVALDKNDPDFWALKAAENFPLAGGHRDRGIFSIYLLNLVHLQPGQGTFQPAGTLHAYLEGVNMELMANSDNVLRGGLTPKHVDVSELMRVLRFAGEKPEILNGQERSATETAYPTPAREFELSRIRLAAGAAYRRAAPHGLEILIVLEGAVRVSAGRQALTLGRGEIILAPDGVGYDLAGESGRAVLFKAATPR